MAPNEVVVEGMLPSGLIGFVVEIADLGVWASVCGSDCIGFMAKASTRGAVCFVSRLQVLGR